MLCHLYFRCRRVRWCMHRTCCSATVPYKMDSGYLVNLPCSPGNRRDPISIKHRKECIKMKDLQFVFTTKHIPQNRQNIPSYPHWSGISAVSVGKWCVQLAVVFATKAHGLWGLGSFFLSGKPMERRDDLINKAEMMHKSYDRTYDKIWIWIYNSKMTKNGWCDAYWCTEFMLLDDNYNPSIVFLSVVVLHYVFDIVLNVEAWRHKAHAGGALYRLTSTHLC